MGCSSNWRPRRHVVAARRGARAAVALLVAATAASCGGGAAPAPDRGDAEAITTPRAPVSKPADADRHRAGPSLEDLVGELVMTKLAGAAPTAEELRAVRSLQVGGIVLFGPSVVDQAQLRRLVEQLDAARRPSAARAGLPERVLVSVDQEGGAIRNVPFAPPERTQPQLAAAGTAAAREAALETGRGLRAAGVSMDLGPVADLASPPNRTMAGRSFGTEPGPVAALVAASVEGLQAGGVAAVAKHFPGFGASTANSDEAVAYVDRSVEQLRSEELPSFRAAIAAHVDAIMVSHGVHRELGSELPGTVDPRIATRLLRDELGYEGVAMTDSMNARGFREAWGDTVPRACPVSIAAGIDLLLLTGSIETARLCRRRILDAVADGTLPEARVREAAERVRVLKARVAPSRSGDL